MLLDRLLIREGIRPGTLTPLDRLSIVGSSGMGALTYHPENQLSSGEDNADLNYLAGEVEKILSEENSGDLSPAYDLVPNDGFNGNHCTTINGKGNPDREDMLEAAENTGFPKKQAQLIYDEIHSNIGRL